ncbi:hypothetical protein ASD11_12540 [Aeromicrobium sp. Root495]|nr:hypothetical protein ASD11_12540 [Aeromicrobium sp. Root495]
MIPTLQANLRAWVALSLVPSLSVAGAIPSIRVWCSSVTTTWAPTSPLEGSSSTGRWEQRSVNARPMRWAGSPWSSGTGPKVASGSERCARDGAARASRAVRSMTASASGTSPRYPCMPFFLSHITNDAFRRAACSRETSRSFSWASTSGLAA